MNSQIKPVAHQPKPVSIERDVNDVVIIEGVRYAGKYFRMLAFPDRDMLYAIQRDGDRIILTTIRDANEAENFFDRVFPEKEKESNDGTD